MKVHSDIIIFELLKLYFEASDKTKITIQALKNGFYCLIDIIREQNNFDIYFNFDKELDKFLDKYQDYFNITNTEIEIKEEIGELFNDIIDSHDKLTIIDYDIQEEIFNVNIYHALNLKIPFSELQEYLELNKKIISLYLKLGENEFHHYYNRLAFKELSDCINELNEKLNDADNSTITKLKVCLNYYNTNLLPNNNEAYNNSVWNIILFSSNKNQLYSLAYDRIDYLTCIIDPNTDEESAEILDSFYEEYNDEASEEYETNKNEAANELDEIPYFLTIFLLYLDNYLNQNPYSISKEALLIKKYLLISTPELQHIEKYFLENYTLENFPEPNVPDYIDANSFEILKNKVIACTTYLAKNNIEMTKPHILAKAITSALFIKTFLDLSTNQNSIQDILDLITNSLFYKQPNYEAVTDLVDKIIFTESPNLQR